MTGNTPDDGIGRDLARIGGWGEPDEVPSVDQLMMRSLPGAPAGASGSVSWGKWVAAVAAAVALIAGIVALRGSGDPDVVAGPAAIPATATEPPGPAPTVPGDCSAVRSFAASMRSLADAAGVDPSASPADLAAGSSAIVRGELTAIRTDVDSATERPIVVLSVRVSEVLKDSAAPAISDDIEVNVPWDRVVIDPMVITDPFVPNTLALLFLDPAGESRRWTVLPEGLWVSCGVGKSAIAASAEPVLWMTESTLDGLARGALTAPPEPPAPPASIAAPPSPTLSESARQEAESLVRQFIEDVAADRFTEAAALWSGYPERLDTRTVHVTQLRSDFAWMFSGDELSFIVNPSWAFTSTVPAPVVTVIGTSGGVKQAAAFVVDPGAGADRIIQRIPADPSTLTPPPFTPMSPGDTITFDFVPVEGGAVAFLGDEALTVDVDHEAFTTTVHLPELLPADDFVVTVSSATPEIPAALAFAFITAG